MGSENFKEQCRENGRQWFDEQYGNWMNATDAGYNRELARELGLDASVLYCNLLYVDCSITERRDENGCFYTTYKQIERNTSMSRHRQNNAREVLEENGYIHCEKRKDNVYVFKILKYIRKGE